MCCNMWPIPISSPLFLCMHVCECVCVCVVHPFCSFHCPEPHERWKQVPYPVLGDVQWLHEHMKASVGGKKDPVNFRGWDINSWLKPEDDASNRKINTEEAPTAEKYFELQMGHVGGFVSFFFKYASIFSSQWNLHHADAALSWLHVFNSSVCLSPWLHWWSSCLPPMRGPPSCGGPVLGSCCGGPRLLTPFCVSVHFIHVWLVPQSIFSSGVVLWGVEPVYPALQQEETQQNK